MGYRIELTARAYRDFKKLPKHVQAQVASRIDGLATDPRPAGAKKLAESEGIYRLRSGNYRILYRIEDDVLLILVLAIGDRREIYRRLSDL